MDNAVVTMPVTLNIRNVDFDGSARGMDYSRFESLQRVLLFDEDDSDDENQGNISREAHSVCAACSTLFESGFFCFSAGYSSKKTACLDGEGYWQKPTSPHGPGGENRKMKKKIYRHLQWEALQVSARKGCKLCCLIEYEINRYMKLAGNSVVWIVAKQESWEEDEMVWSIEGFDPSITAEDVFKDERVGGKAALKLSRGASCITTNRPA